MVKCFILLTWMFIIPSEIKQFYMFIICVHTESHIVYNLNLKYKKQFILVGFLFFTLQKENVVQRCSLTLLSDLPEGSHWEVAELEHITLSHQPQSWSFLQPNELPKLKQEGRALPCLPSARNVHIAQHKYFIALWTSVNDFESVLIFYLEVLSKYQGAGKFSNMELWIWGLFI